MPWVVLDDTFPQHPKVAQAGGDAAWLYLCGLAYCNRLLTDGVIPKPVIPQLSDRRRPSVLAGRLVSVGLWVDEGDHYRVHDFHEYQPTASEVREKRARVRAARADAGRKGGRANRQANVEQTGSTAEAGRQQNGSPNPYPLPSSYSSSSDLQEACGKPDDDDDDRQLEGLWRDWAHNDLERLVADGKPAPRNPPAWLTTAANRRRTEYAEPARALWDANPELGVDDVMRRLDPPPAPKPKQRTARFRNDWGSYADDALEELPDGTVRRKPA